MPKKSWIKAVFSEENYNNPHPPKQNKKTQR